MLAGQTLGIKEIDEGIWLVSFMHYDLGYFDLEQKTLQPLDNPFGPRLSPMSQVRCVTHVSGPDPRIFGAGEGIRTLDPNLGKREFALFHQQRAVRQSAWHYDSRAFLRRSLSLANFERKRSTMNFIV